MDFHGQKRTNETHRSTTDPEATLYRKGNGKESKLSHLGHVLNENWHGLVVGIEATEANGTAERTTALDLVDELGARHGKTPKTLGADKGYDRGGFYREMERRQIEPPVPLVGQRLRRVEEVKTHEKTNATASQRMQVRQSSEGYRLSQKCRKKIEEVFGWLKGVAGLSWSRWVGRWKLQQAADVGVVGGGVQPGEAEEVGPGGAKLVTGGRKRQVVEDTIRPPLSV